MERMEEIQIPEIEEKKHWGGPDGRKWKIAAGLLAVGMVVFACSVFAFTKWYFSAERVLLRAFGNLTEEVLERRELWEAATGNGPGEEWNRAKFTTVFNLSGDGLPLTLGVDTTLERDADVRKMKSRTKFSVSNTKLAELEVYGEDKTLVLTLPEFFEENFAFDTERIDEQYNGSLFARIFGTLKGYEISVDLFPKGNPVSWMRYFEGWQENVRIEKLEKSVDISVPEKDNRQYRCGQYRLTIAADWINTLFTDGVEAAGGFWAKDGMTAGVAQDIIINVAMEEENDRIVRISFEEPLVIFVGSEEGRIEVKTSGEVCFLGEGRSVDDILVSMQTELPLTAIGIGERLLAVFGNKSGTEDNIIIELRAESLYNEADACVTSDLHKLTVSVDRVGSFKLTGKIKLEPLEEAIEAPAGETIRLFEISEEEYGNMREQVMKKIWRWLKALSIFG